MQKDIIKYSIVAPAYNEEENIDNTIQEWQEYIERSGLSAEIVITNDGSKDNTKKILKCLEKKYSNLQVIHFEKNGGYGRALNSSMLSAKGEWLVTIDSDGQFRAEDIQKLIKLQSEKKYDLVSGFRIKKNDSYIRIFADRCLNILIRILFNIKLKDTNCALKLIKKESFESFELESLGYSTPTEIILKSDQAGFKIGETGIMHLERQGGVSKLKLFNTAFGFFKVLIYLRLKFHLKRKGLIN